MGEIKNLKINLESKVLQSNKVIIIPHNNIDFDAIGSAIGISVITTKLNKPSYIIVNDPIYNMDHGAKLVMEEAKDKFQIINKEKYLQIISNDDLYVLTDVNKSNLVSLNNELSNRENIIIIDHHEEGEKTIDSSYKYIDTTVSSASEIVSKLLGLFKIKIPKDVANYLLAGIHLDTNRLNKNTTPDTFRLISKLMEYGATNDKINSWFMEDFNSDRRVQSLVSMVMMYTYKMAIIKAPEDEEYTREELAKAADYLLKYGVDVSYVIGNISDKIISISARSTGKVDVGSVLKEMGGGGNIYSAATKIENESLDEVHKKLVRITKPEFYVK